MSSPRNLLSSRPVRVALIVVAVFVCVLTGTTFAAAAIHAAHDNQFLPNTSIGGVDMTGKYSIEAAPLINQAFDTYLRNGITFSANGKQVVLDSTSIGITDPDATNDLLRLDADASMQPAIDRGETNFGPFGLRYLSARILSIFVPKKYPLIVTINRPAIQALLEERLATIEQPVTEPRLDWKNDTFTVAPGASGNVFALDEGLDTMARQIAEQKTDAISLTTHSATPKISQKSAEALAVTATDLIKTTPLTLTTKELSWPITTSTRAAWLQLTVRNEQPIIGLDPMTLDSSLASIAAEVETEPQDAKFTIQDGKVAAFQTSTDGVAIDRDALRTALEKDWIMDHKTTLALPTVVNKARITTADANNLGIKEILGVGTSTYEGSPANRIKNIKNALNKLNGLLIKPDEEFSLIAALQPFTIEGGYLPEKVIKGDRITAEIGGGACQIGTTTFRAAMLSGLPILERQNHSLVVHYYNDPQNGNPGTDATIYDPAPDFKFKNDTGNTILFQTAMDTKKQELRFTFWGTTDGRAGTYTPPVVSRRIPAGATKEIKTTDLPVGTKDCQNAFPGADTSFTYTVTKADGTKTDRVFTSHYRALPKICMVGATAEEIAGTAVPTETIPSADVPVVPPTTNINAPAITNTPVVPTNTNTVPATQQ
ncbi:VanW family protein [Patescibacteria group bacterium]|nr:VanW family protein [Patescibacteria group bacterium]